MKNNYKFVKKSTRIKQNRMSLRKRRQTADYFEDFEICDIS